MITNRANIYQSFHPRLNGHPRVDGVNTEPQPVNRWGRVPACHVLGDEVSEVDPLLIRLRISCDGQGMASTGD